MKQIRFFFPAIAIILCATLYGCSSATLLKSAWEGNQITIDGKDDDWKDNSYYLSGAKAVVGLKNDSTFLYVLFKVDNRRQTFLLLRSGFTVWFDPAGGTEKKFGIHFPLPNTRPERFSDGQKEEDNIQAEPILGDIEVIEKGLEPQLLTQPDAKGVHLRMMVSEEALIYELQIPLHSSSAYPYAIGNAGKEIGIGFESGKFERPTMQSGLQGEMPRGGGRRGIRGGGRRQSEDPQGGRPEPFDFWLKTVLE